MKKKNIKKQNGISLIALTATILVLSIVTSIIVYNAKDNIEIREYKKLDNDLEVLQEKVEMYYLKNEKLPVLEKDNEIIKYTGNSKFKNNKQINDNDNYYILDLNYIDGITLNFGSEFYKINNEKTDFNKKTDIYIINEQSHRIYYAKGIQVDEIVYYTIGTDTKIPMINN